MHLMHRGEVKQYKFHEGGWAMEYARGEWLSCCFPKICSDGFCYRSDPADDVLRTCRHCFFDSRCRYSVRYRSHNWQGNDSQPAARQIVMQKEFGCCPALDHSILEDTRVQGDIA